MQKEDKILLVKNLSKKFDENNIFYIMDASGLEKNKSYKKNFVIILKFFL